MIVRIVVGALALAVAMPALAADPSPTAEKPKCACCEHMEAQDKGCDCCDKKGHETPSSGQDHGSHQGHVGHPG